MSEELLYTSAPRGLKAGSRGFCTVEATAGMPPAVAQLLESLSGYRHLNAPGDPANPVVLRHVIATVAGAPTHILSRIADAGLDYSGRSNKIAHHVALPRGGLNAAGPAWTQRQDGFHQATWDGEAKTIPAGPSLPGPSLPAAAVPPAPCRTWAAVAGDAGWAGVLADAVATGSPAPLPIVVRADQDILSLVGEAIALLPPGLRWQATYTTFHTQLPPGAQCAWRFVIDGTKEAEETLKRRDRNQLDLRQPLGSPPAGPWVEAARTGERPSQPATAPAGVRKATRTEASPFIEDPGELTVAAPGWEPNRPTPPPPPPGRTAPHSPRDDFPQPPAKRSVGPIVVTLVALLATILIVAAVLVRMDVLDPSKLQAVQNANASKARTQVEPQDETASQITSLATPFNDEGAGAVDPKSDLIKHSRAEGGSGEKIPASTIDAEGEKLYDAAESISDPKPASWGELLKAGTNYTKDIAPSRNEALFNFKTISATAPSLASVRLAVGRDRAGKLEIQSNRAANSITLTGRQKQLGESKPLASLVVGHSGVRLSSLHPLLPLSDLLVTISDPSSELIQAKLTPRKLIKLQSPPRPSSDASYGDIKRFFANPYQASVEPRSILSIALYGKDDASPFEQDLREGMTAKLLSHEIDDWSVELEGSRTSGSFTLAWRVRSGRGNATSDLPIEDVISIIRDWESWTSRLKANRRSCGKDGLVEQILELYYGGEPDRNSLAWPKWNRLREEGRPDALRVAGQLEELSDQAWPETASALSSEDGRAPFRFTLEQVIARGTRQQDPLGFPGEPRLKFAGKMKAMWWRQKLANYNAMTQAVQYIRSVRCDCDVRVQYVLPKDGDKIELLVATTRDIPEAPRDE